MKVPFFDLQAGLAPVQELMISAVRDIMRSGRFIGGDAVSELETKFAAACGTEHAVAVSSGTDALVLMLRAFDIGGGDEVITAPNSFFATAEAIALVGATPRFADVCRDSLTLDPEAVKQVIGPKTRAILPVHLYGQCADISRLAHVAAEHNVLLLEDAAQAHGAAHKQRRAGSLGSAAAFSFYPSKNLGAPGEGGAVTTNDPDIASRLRALRDHGQRHKHVHEEIGYNARLNAIQCACLSIRLDTLEQSNAGRKRAAAWYRSHLDNVDGIELVAEHPDNECVYHLFVVRVANRDAVMQALREKQIDTAIHYPTPIHLQPAFRGLTLSAGSFPIAEEAAERIVSLPMYPEITEDAVAYVASQLQSIVT